MSKESPGIILLRKFFAGLMFIVFLPVWAILFLLMKITTRGSFIYKQKRVGKNNTTFTIFKIRTMTLHAERLKNTYMHLNEADGPVFKIKNDPRYTKIGKLISRFGLDETPQIVNILKGEMAFVGPRPLPLEEAKKIPSEYHSRLSILPGVTSPWVIQGGHTLSFKQWMELDKKYIKKKNIIGDVRIIILTVFFLLGFYKPNKKNTSR